MLSSRENHEAERTRAEALMIDRRWRRDSASAALAAYSGGGGRAKTVRGTARWERILQCKGSDGEKRGRNSNRLIVSNAMKTCSRKQVRR